MTTSPKRKRVFVIQEDEVESDDASAQSFHSAVEEMEVESHIFIYLD
jgi:hypothetical protein